MSTSTTVPEPEPAVRGEQIQLTPPPEPPQPGTYRDPAQVEVLMSAPEADPTTGLPVVVVPEKKPVLPETGASNNVQAGIAGVLLGLGLALVSLSKGKKGTR
jgi:LPXTG-motif cell wall-anchored protein